MGVTHGTMKWWHVASSRRNDAGERELDTWQSDKGANTPHMNATTMSGEWHALAETINPSEILISPQRTIKFSLETFQILEFDFLRSLGVFSKVLRGRVVRKIGAFGFRVKSARFSWFSLKHRSFQSMKWCDTEIVSYPILSSECIVTFSLHIDISILNA